MMVFSLFSLFDNPSFCDVLLKTIPSERIGTGKTLIILVQSSFPLKDVRVSFMRKRYPLYPISAQPGLFWAFQGIPLGSKPDIYQIRMVAMKKNGDTIVAQKSVQVSVTPYPKEHVTVAPKKRHLLTSQALKDEGMLLSALFSKRGSIKWWSGRFLLPIHGRNTSPFGIQRIYNDGRVSWPHKGIDIAAEEGTRIVAPNAGKVVLTRSFIAHGKTLVIDHGQGVFSVLIHLQDFMVKEGHFVRKGDLIGHSGNTGITNAPNLHWGLSAGNVRVNPLEWAKKSMDRLDQ